MVEFNFDSSGIAPMSTIDAIPSGWYLFTITKSEFKETSNKRGWYLQLTYMVMDGPRKGAIVIERLNLRNENETAVQIAESALTSLCHAVGKPKFSDTVELHNIPFKAKVKYVPPMGDYDASNDVKGYKLATDDTPPPDAEIPVATTMPGQAPAAPTAAPAAPAAPVPAAAPPAAAAVPAAAPAAPAAAPPIEDDDVPPWMRESPTS